MQLRRRRRMADAPKGSLVIAPGGTPHGFENRTAKRAGALNVSVPGDFEPRMHGIADWFSAQRRSAPDAPATTNAPSTNAPRRTSKPRRAAK